MLLFGHHRRHKLACCTCFKLVVVLFHVFSKLLIFVSSIVFHFPTEYVVCVLRNFPRLSLMCFSWFGYMKMSLLDLFLFDEIL